MITPRRGRAVHVHVRAACSLLALLVAPAFGPDNGVGQTPAMGYNTWDGEDGVDGVCWCVLGCTK